MDHEVQREQLEHLEGLCKARYLRDYEEHIEALRPLFGWIEKTSGRDSEQSDTAVAELIVKLFTAARVGFERLLEACEGVHISQRVNTSCLNVIACVCGWILRAYLPGRDILSAPLPRQTAEQQIIRSGFLPTFATTCSLVAASISWHLQISSTCSSATANSNKASVTRSSQRLPRSLQARAAAVTAAQIVDLARFLLVLWVHMVEVFGSGSTTGPWCVVSISYRWRCLNQQAVTTMVPASTLCLALLRYLSSNSSCCSAETTESISSSACGIAHHFSNVLRRELHYATQLGIRDCSNDIAITAMQDNFRHSQSQELFILILAAHAARLQQQQQRQQDSQQHICGAQAGDDSVGNLLQLLGLSKQIAAQFAEIMVTFKGAYSLQDCLCAAVDNLICSITLSRKLSICATAGNRSCSSDSSTEASAALHTALLGTLLQLLQMLPGVESQNNCIRCMQAVARLYDGWLVSNCCSQEQAAVAATVSRDMIRAIVIAVGNPAGLQQCNSAAADAECAEVKVMLSRLLGLFTSVNARIHNQGLMQTVSAIEMVIDWHGLMQQHPLTVITALEVTSRVTASQKLASISIMKNMVPGIIKAAADNQDLLAAVEAAAAAASSRRSSKKQNTNDLLSCLTRKSSAARLLSCMISCLKLTCAYIKNKPEKNLALQVAIDVALWAQKYAIAAATAAAAAAATIEREEVASQHSISCSAAAVPWAHVVARALYYCTTALLWPHTAGTAAARERACEQDSSKAVLLPKQQGDGTVAQPCVSVSLLQQLSELVAWCHPQLQFRSSSSDSRASNADRCSLQHTKARQQLQQEYEQLQQGLAAAVSLAYPAASRQDPQQQASETGDAAAEVQCYVASDARIAMG